MSQDTNLSKCCCELVGEINSAVGEICEEIDVILQLSGSIYTEPQICGEINVMLQLSGSICAEPQIFVDNIEVPTGITTIYDGAYTVIPKVLDQVLETENKTMRSDVFIEEIPTFWTQNSTGMTFIVGN